MAFSRGENKGVLSTSARKPKSPSARRTDTLTDTRYWQESAFFQRSGKRSMMDPNRNKWICCSFKAYRISPLPLLVGQAMVGFHLAHFCVQRLGETTWHPKKPFAAGSHTGIETRKKLASPSGSAIIRDGSPSPIFLGGLTHGRSPDFPTAVGI